MSNRSIEQNRWQQLASLIFGVTGDIQYGKVEITIHDARVVQMEVTEKFRLPAEAPSARPPGSRAAAP